MKKISIAIHGGAGTILKEDMTTELEDAYRQALKEAMDAGYAVLENGGTAINSVKAAVVVMEDSPLFNAGKGSVFTNEGKNEMDAAIMNGKTLAAGSVAGSAPVCGMVVFGHWRRLRGVGGAGGGSDWRSAAGVAAS